MILRNFQFLDTAMMEDYLATLEGSIVDGPIDQKETGNKEKGIKGGLNYFVQVNGGYTSNMSAETRQTRIVTDAAKFQRLYELLKNDHIQYLDAFDEEIWNQLKRGELLEVQAKIRIPEFLQLIQSAESLSPFADFMKMHGQTDPHAYAAFQGFSGLGKMFASKPVPLLFEAASSPSFRFVAELPRQFLRAEINELHGEGIVVGKILRIVPRGEKFEVFSLIPSSIPNSIHKSQYKKLQKDLKRQKIAEIVKGPAIVIAPLAVYR